MPNTHVETWVKSMTVSTPDRPVKRAGLEGIRLHDLRHFYASGLIADGCDVVTVQRVLGNAKASTTLDTYAKLWPSGEDRTRRAASSLARQVLGEKCGQDAGREGENAL